MENETEEAWSRLEKWQNNIDEGMTCEKYLSLCEKMEIEPDPNKMPLEIQDFPSDIQKAMVLFNKLGDRIYPDIGYLGKDYTQLPIYMEVYEVEDKRIFLETLLRLDARVIQKSQEALKRERDKLKRT